MIAQNNIVDIDATNEGDAISRLPKPPHKGRDISAMCRPALIHFGRIELGSYTKSTESKSLDDRWGLERQHKPTLASKVKPNYYCKVIL